MPVSAPVHWNCKVFLGKKKKQQKEVQNKQNRQQGKKVVGFSKELEWKSHSAHFSLGGLLLKKAALSFIYTGLVH